MKYAVLGAGLMGRAAAYDLLQQKDTELVLLADGSQAALDEVRRLLGDKRLVTRRFDASDEAGVRALLAGVDACVAAVHYQFNALFTRAAIAAGTHLCDLGGNNDVVDEQLKLHRQARAAGVSIIPDCGLAPGMVSVLARWGIERFPWVDSVHIRVGGLPQKPRGALRYGRVFSVQGLINEYIEPVRALRNGKLVTVEPLSEIEALEFPRPFGTLEAFTTSGGISTLVDTYRGRLKNLDYKTIRYPGHGHAMRCMYELGLFERRPVTLWGQSAAVAPRDLAASLIERNIPLIHDDATLVRVVFAGRGKRHELTMIDRATARPRLTAMMRTTAFPAAIISQMQARGQVSELGVLPQERCVPPAPFIAALRKRKILVRGIT